MSATKSRARDLIEVLSAFGVVASLIFVGLEVRQNTAAIRGAAIQEMSAQSIDYLTAWATDEYLPGLLQRTTDGALPEDFTPEENQRLLLTYITLLRAYESRYLQVQLGILDQDMFEAMAGRGQIYERPWLRATWGPIIESSIGPEFAAFFKERLRIE